MAFAYIRRVAKGTGIDTPDNDHVHHRLVRLGHGPRRTVVILWTWTAVLSGFVLYPLFAPESNAIIPFAVVVLGLLLFTLFRPGLHNGRRKEHRALKEPERAKPAAGNQDEVLLSAAPPPKATTVSANGAEPDFQALPLAGTVQGNGVGPGNHAAPRIVPGPEESGPRPETALS
jgi:hypothetical protein